MKVLAISLASLLVVPIPVMAQEPGVAFLDGESRVFDPLGGKQGVVILNGSPERETLTLLLLDATGPVGSPPMALMTPIGPDGGFAKESVGSAETWTPELDINPAATPGEYSARLVAYSTDGSHAVLDATLSISGPSSSTRPGSFKEPFPDPVVLYAEHSGLGWLGIGALTAPARTYLVSATDEALVVGPLVDEFGRQSVPTFDSATGELTFRQAPGAGVYKGTIGKSSEVDATPAKLVGISLTVRDTILFPLLVLVVGLWLAFRADYWFTRRGPRLALEARLLEMREKSGDRTDEDRRYLGGLETWVGGNREPVSLRTAGASPVDLLLEASRSAVKDFDETPSAEKREERWGAQGTEFAKVADLYCTQVNAAEIALRANDDHAIIARLLGPARAANLAESKLALDARDALAGGEFTTRSELSTKAQQRSAIAERLDKAKALVEILARLWKLAEGDEPNRRRVSALMDKVASDPVGDLDQLRAHLDAARKLFDDIARDRRTAGRDADAEVYEPGREATDFEAIKFLFESQDQVDTGGGGFGEDAYDLSPTSGIARAKLYEGTWIYSLVVSAFVVATGLGTQYLANTKFGSAADYASLFVWGFTAAALTQLLKYAANALSSRALARRTQGDGM